MGNSTGLQAGDCQAVNEPFEQMLLLENGEIDIAWNLQPDQAQILTDNPDFQMAQSLTFSIMFMTMNLGYPPLESSEVRDAIRYAIDYDGIVKYILQNAAVKIQTFIPIEP